MARPFVAAFKIGACLGFVIAVLVLAYGYLLPTMQSIHINDLLIFIACPPSFILIATDNAGWPIIVFANLIVVAANAFWYGMLFEVMTMLFRYRSTEKR
jgi:hypothetical protein